MAEVFVSCNAGAVSRITVVHNCTTVSGADPGADCVFPFTFNGQVITECTTVDGDDTPWCSTLTDQNGIHVNGQGKWGYCASNCTTKQEWKTVDENVNPITIVVR